MRSLPFQAIVSDLDGTLLNSNHVIGDFTIKTLDKLEQQGVDIILATGRNHTDVSSILSKVETERAVMITSNGAKIHDLKGNLLYSNTLPEDLALELYKTPFDHSKLFINTYQDDGWFLNIDVPEMKKYHQDSGFMYQVTDFSQHHAKGVEKVFFIAREPKDLLDVEHYLKQNFSDIATIVYSSLTSIEVMNKDVSKGNALKQLIEQRSYTLSDCIAFGDGMNDVELLTYVGKGCVMGNADSRLKQACPQLEQIGLNNHEAVASYLRATFGVY